MLIGLVFTALVRSSSVTTGLAILMVYRAYYPHGIQGILPAVAAIPIVIGSNIGTTSTGLMASLGMKPVAHATAAANLLFNTVGVLVYFPFLRPSSRLMVDQFGAGSMSVAWAHLTFNVTIGLAFLWLLDRLNRSCQPDFSCDYYSHVVVHK